MEKGSADRRDRQVTDFGMDALAEFGSAGMSARTRTAILSRVQRAATSDRHWDTTLEIVSDELASHVCDSCSVYTRDGGDFALVSSSSGGLDTVPDGQAAEIATVAQTEAFRAAVERGEAVVAPMAGSDGHVEMPPTLLHVPVTAGGQVVGVLVLARRDPAVMYTAGDIDLAQEIVAWATLMFEKVRLEGRCRDVEADLARSELRLRQLAETVPVVLHRVRLKPAFAFDYVSPSLLALLGYTPEQIYENPWVFWDSVHPDDRGLIERVSVSPQELAGSFVLRHYHRDGHIVWTETRCSVEYDDVGTAVALEGVTTDITASKDLEAELARRALHDPLTGLPNRMLFQEHLRRALARRPSRGASVALLLIDLDGFTAVNDNFGHAAGDTLLSAVASLLSRSVRPSDTLARLGDDEFAVLVDEVGEPEVPVRMCARINENLADVEIEGRVVGATASIGVAYAGADVASDADDLMRHADAAMRAAKNAGGGCYEIFESHLRARVDERLQMEQELRRALEQQEFVLQYQPEVRLRTGEIVRVEALVRWEHPERGLLEPDSFLQSAEETGLVVPIGIWVLGEACRLRRAWQEAFGPAAPVVCVNLSPRQLADPGLVGEVAAVVASTGVESSGLMVDVTERGLLEDPAVSLAVLQAFGNLGIKVAVDDFGTGYASLAIVRSFPVDVVKIDRSVVGSLCGDPATEAVCRAIIDLSSGLGLEVSAEGVETANQRKRLLELGCTFAQGDLFAAPAPAESVHMSLGGMRLVR